MDGVAILGEHGDYPENERGQTMYPRRHMFEQVCGPRPIWSSKLT